MPPGQQARTLRAQVDAQLPTATGREWEMRKYFEIGGVVAAVVLVAFGVVALVLGVNGRSTVSNSIKQERIVGSGDMTPAAIAKEAQAAKLPSTVSLPTC